MSELPKAPLPTLVHAAEKTRPEHQPFLVRNAMRESDFAGFTREGQAVLARVLRRAIEKNRKAVAR